mgnify:FL=1
MNREILFRGKTTIKESNHAFNGTWVEGDLIHSGGKLYMHPIANMVEINGEIGKLIIMHEVIPETVRQYTGLTDRNGVKIFEGDIVKSRNKLYEIKYLTEYARFLAVLPNGVFNPVAVLNCEVVGNIHDNPDLIGGVTNA